jgi:ankyrin repeat protein
MSEQLELAALVRALDAENPAPVAEILSRLPGLARAELPAEHGSRQTLLHRAVPGDGDRLTDAHLAIVQRLLEAGAAVDAPGWIANNGICTPLTGAAWGGHAEMIRLLVRAGADPNGLPEQGARGHRPIDVAAEHGHADAVEALIEAGADHSLAHLLKVGAVTRMERLLAVDPDAVARPLDGTPPLHLAAMAPNSVPMLRWLLAHGAAVGAVDALGRTALHVAIEYPSREAVQLLLEAGAPVDLFAAAGTGDTARVARLLTEEPSLARAMQADGTTPLFYAAWAGDVTSVTLLLDAGAAVSPKAKRFWACLTPLHAALQQRHRPVAAILLEHGADVNAFAAEPSQYWPTPLHAAARWGTQEDVRLLLDYGADLNGGSAVPESMDAGGLAWAVCAGNLGLVTLLLERGLNLRHDRHREVLHLAAERGREEMVRLLLDHGADPCALDAQGETPLDRARARGRSGVVELLEARTG